MDQVFERGTYTSLATLVEMVMVIPCSNAAVERIFSLSKIQWSDDRNRMNSETMEAILQVVCNFNLTCSAMHERLVPKKAEDVQKKIGGWKSIKSNRSLYGNCIYM